VSDRLVCPCGALACEGRDRATVGRLRDGRVVVDALLEWQPGGAWTYMYCDTPAKPPTLRLEFDALVQDRLVEMAAEREQSDEQLRSLNRRLRAAWVAAAEERSLVIRGRGLTADELEAALAEYPGDVSTELTAEE
jgi:hypothetical protein